MKGILILLLCFSVTEFVLAQSRISTDEYRGTEEAIARGVLKGNAIETNYRNHGEHSRWGDLPWGVWNEGDCSSAEFNCIEGGGIHLDGFGFFVAAKVIGERAKWSSYFDEEVRDTVLNPVIMSYKYSGVRLSPYSGDQWGWLPLNGFHNPFRLTNGIEDPIPAISSDNTSWPSFWPDRLSESMDSGWPDSWNGFRGKGLVTGQQESFYVMDDFSDREYLFGQETEGPHSDLGVYYPSPSDSSIGGLGLQTEVRTFQFNDVLAKDILFTQYRITNLSEKNLDSLWVGSVLDVGLGNEQNDDEAFLYYDDNLVVAWDLNGWGSTTLSYTYDIGWMGLLVLEYSKMEENQIDEDVDGIIDESKFNGPGQLLEGKENIDSYLEENYNMEIFQENFVALENFPAYKNERWWTGDEDMDWVAYDDLNINGIRDANEPVLDDVGRDGLGPDAPNYPGPDEGEDDGIPTQGEPNFGEQDMMEAENIGQISFYDNNTQGYYEVIGDLDDDSWTFERIKLARVTGQTYVTPTINEERYVLSGIGPHSLKSGTSSNFTIALIFGEDEEDLFVNVERAKAIYESDYGQSALLTNNENEQDFEVPTKVSLSQNYPNPFNPTTNIEFSLSRSEVVTLEVFDITGRRVQSMISNQNYPAGTHSVQFDASSLSSGVYMYRLEVAGEVFTRKLTLIK